METDEHNMLKNQTPLQTILHITPSINQPTDPTDTQLCCPCEVLEGELGYKQHTESAELQMMSIANLF